MKRKSSPPKLGLWLLRKIYDDDLFEDISGDFLEVYHDNVEAKGKFYASFHYLKDTFLSFRNIDLKKKKHSSSDNPYPMLKNLLVIAVRSLTKRMSYSVLNIAGLATGMAFAFLLWIYISHQHSYDRHFTNARNIYRVNIDCNMNGKRDVYSNVPQPVARALKNDYPFIEETLRVGLTNHTGVIEYEGKRIKSEELLIAEASIFQFFDREFFSGIAHQALIEPNSIVISESLAYKIFGSLDVIGKTVLFPQEKKILKVTGVMKDEFRPSHLPMEAVISWATFPEYELDWWYGAHTYTYISLTEGSSVKNLSDQMPSFFTKYMKPTFDEFSGTGRIFFQPLTDIYLSEEYVWEPYPHGSRGNVMALSLVAAFLIVFAIINYINMATARAVERAAEVGIRKVLGSTRSFLWLQFFSESMILALFSGVIALALSWTLLPYFNHLTDLSLSSRSFFEWKNVAMLSFLAAAIGLFAGMFPAFYLSSVEALKIVKGRFASSGQGEFLRKALVTTQFLIAALLIAGIWIVYQQIGFIKSKEIGFEKENLVNIRIPEDSSLEQGLPFFINEVKRLPEVVSATLTNVDMHKEANSFSPVLRNEDGSTFRMGADLIQVDADFIETIGASIIEGRNFRENSRAEQESAVLINEAAAKKFGWSEKALEGTFAGWTFEEPANRKVIGVVKDFHLGVSYQLVHPTIILLSYGGGSNLYLRIQGDEIRRTISRIETNWSKSFPNHKMEFSFVDENLASLYHREQKFLSLLAALCVIILFIASLGVIGLISYTTLQKRKEIAIRKVLGSSFQSILTLLSGKFIRLLLIANLMALPLSWYLLQLWLNNFAYRIEISPIPFVIAFFSCLVFTACSLLFHTVRAAKRNPIDALKYE